MNINITVTGAIFASGIAVSAWAHGGATGIVKERMDGMSTMGKAVKSLVPMMQGKIPLNPAQIRAAAQAIGQHSGDTLIKKFPKGSGKHPSKAKPAIWQDPQGFSALAKRLQTLAKGLEQAAGNPLMGQSGGNSMMGSSTSMMGGGTGMMGGSSANMPDLDQLAQMPVDGVYNMIAKTCSACHSRFRAE